MKKRPVDGERAVVAHDQAPIVPDPADGALHDPAPLVSPEGSPILGRRPRSVPVMRRNQLDSSLRQAMTQGSLSKPIGDHTHGLLTGRPG